MLILSTSSLKWYWIHKIFTIVKKAKYDWIDLIIDDKNYDTLDWEYLKNLVEEFNLPILSITAPDKWLNKQKIDKILNIAELVKTQVINFYPPVFLEKNNDWYLKYLLKIKKESWLTIAIQNVEQKFKLFIIPEFKHSWLTELKRLTWDTALNIWNVDKSSWIDLIKLQTILWNTVKNIFLNDKNWQKDWLLPWNAWWWISYLPIESFLMKLKWVWYDWFFSLRVRSNILWSGDDSKVLYNLEQTKKYLTKHFYEYKP